MDNVQNEAGTNALPATLRAEYQKLVSQIRPDYALSLTRLNVTPDGDFTPQLAAKAEKTAASYQEVVAGPRNLVLGQAGSGKTALLLQIQAQAAQTALQSATPERLPFYLDLAGLADPNAALEEVVQKVAAVQSAVLSAQPLLLIDHLEKLVLEQAPRFFFRLNAWQEQTAAAKLVLSCHYLDFMLYAPWLKGASEWQYFGTTGLDWSNLKARLADWSPEEANLLEQTGLHALLTQPGWLELLDRRQGLRNWPSLITALEEILRSSGAVALQAHVNFNLQPLGWPEKDKTGTPAPTGLIIEKHPLTGLTRLSQPAARHLLAALVLKRTPSQFWPGLLKAITDKLSPPTQIELLRLSYLLTEDHDALFNAALTAGGREWLKLLLAVEPVAPQTYGHDWQNYLQGLADERGLKNGGLQVLKMCAELESDIDNLPNFLAETALNVLERTGQYDSSAMLRLARLQERRGQPALAIQRYQQIDPTELLGAVATLSLSQLLIDSHQVEQAEEHLTALYQALTGYQAEVAFWLSVVKQQQRQPHEALQYAQQAAQTGAPRYRLQFGQILANVQDQRAGSELEKLTREQPDYAAGWYELGQWQLEHGQRDEAIASLRQSVALSPQTGSYLYRLGSSLQEVGQHSEAYPYLQAASQQTDKPEAWLRLGLVAFYQNLYSEAAAAFDRADPQKLGALVWIYRAAVLYRQNQSDRALSALKQAVTNSPDDHLLRLLMGRLSEGTSQAIEHYKRAAQSEQPALRLEALLGLARLGRQYGRSDIRAAVLDQLIALEPNTRRYHYEMAHHYMEQNANSAAQNSLAQALANVPPPPAPIVNPVNPGLEVLNLFDNRDQEDYELNYHYGQILQQNGQTGQAEQILGRLLERLDEQHQPQQRAEVLHLLGQQYLESNVARAGIFLASAIRTYPNNGTYHLTQARADLKSDDHDRARQSLLTATQLDPGLHPAWGLLAELSLGRAGNSTDQGEIQAGLNLYLRALETAPNEVAYLRGAAKCAFWLGYYNQSEKLLARLTEADTDWEIALLKVCQLEKGGEVAAALTQVEALLTKAARSEVWVVACRLAHAQSDLGKLAQYAGQLDTEEWPGYQVAPVLADLGWANLQGQSWEAAAHAYQLACDNYTTRPPGLDEFYLVQMNAVQLAEWQVALAVCKFQLGAHSTALALLNTVLADAPDHYQAHYYRGMWLVGLERYREALPNLKQASAINPGGDLLYRLGLSYLNIDEAGAAVAAFEQAASTEPGLALQSQYQFKLGQAYAKVGNAKASRAAYVRALQIEPGNSSWQQELAQTYIKEGDKLAAVQPLQAAVLLEGEQVELRRQLAELYFDLDWFEEAAAEYEQLTQLAPREAEYLARYGECLMRLNLPEQALPHLEAALDLDDTLEHTHFMVGNYYLEKYRQENHDNILIQIN